MQKFYSSLNETLLAKLEIMYLLVQAATAMNILMTQKDYESNDLTDSSTQQFCNDVLTVKVVE